MSKRGFSVCYRPPGQTPVRRRSTDGGGGGNGAGGPAEETPGVGGGAPGERRQQDAAWGRGRRSCFAPRPPADYAPDTSMYMLAALNKFGEAGGMAPLARRLSSGRASFAEVLATFRLGKALRTHASSRSLKEANWTLKECAAQALLSVPPETMRAATKTEIAECVSSLRELASTVANSPHGLVQELEQLELAMAMKVIEDATFVLSGKPWREGCRLVGGGFAHSTLGACLWPLGEHYLDQELWFRWLVVAVSCPAAWSLTLGCVGPVYARRGSVQSCACMPTDPDHHKPLVFSAPRTHAGAHLPKDPYDLNGMISCLFCVGRDGVLSWADH